MQNNLLAFWRKADVIKCAVKRIRDGNVWANLSTRISWCHWRRSGASSVTTRTMSTGLRRVGKFVRGVSVRPGQQLKSYSRITFAAIRGRVRLVISEVENKKRNRSKLLVALVRYHTNVYRRDGEVLKHFPTAKPSATVIAAARDLFQILSMWCGRSSSAPCRVSLAISAYVLRRFAFNCKEGARHG